MKSTKVVTAGYMAFVAAALSVSGCISETSKPSSGAGLSNQQETEQVTSDPATINWTGETTIGQIVAERPQTARVFELVGIDYCCGGNTRLSKAAEEQNVDVERLLGALSVVGIPTPGDEQRNWQQADIGELMDHIVARHHTWLRRELPHLTKTTNTVFSVHGEAHPELKEVAEIVGRFGESIIPHLDDEEQRIFPAVRQLAAGNPPADVAAMLSEMRTDHDDLGENLHRLRALTDGFVEPAGACATYREMLTGLKSLERDMLTHVHLENNVLLPRANKLLEAASDQ